jgi:hypothetical protein
MNANLRLNARGLTVLGAGLWLMSDSSSAACLMKTRQIDGARTAFTLMLAPEREVAEYSALGFSRVTCPVDMRLIRHYVERLCAEPGKGNVQPLNTEMIIGRPRTRACASARAGLAESTR